MKNLSTFFCAVCCFVCVSIALADRNDIWSAASVSISEVRLSRLSDGGCSVRAIGTYTKQDGGIANEGSQFIEVAGANRTTCLDILDNKAPVLFKNDRNL